jgi:hypothetical protein
MPNLFGVNLAMIEQGVTSLVERLLALRATIALATIGSKARVDGGWDNHKTHIRADIT